MRLLVLTGTSQYNAFDVFVDDITKDIANLGWEFDVCVCVDGTDYQAITLSNYDAIFSLNGIGLNITAGDGTLKEFCASKPVFVWLLDHPLHLLRRFMDYKVTLLCMDKEHVEFCQFCGFESHYFPHSISLVKSNSVLDNQAIENNGDILFPATYFDTEHERDKLAPAWSQIEKFVAHSYNITDFLRYIGILPIPGRGSVTELNQNMFAICLRVNLYLRAKGRKNLLERCHKAGLPLKVIGIGVHNYKADFPEFQYLEPVGMDELNRNVKKAAFVVHNTPGFRQGLHDRALNAMLLGTAVITDSDFITSQFPSACVTPEQATSYDLDCYEQNIRDAQNLLLGQYSWQSRFTKLFARYGL